MRGKGPSTEKDHHRMFRGIGDISVHFSAGVSSFIHELFVDTAVLLTGCLDDRNHL